MNRAYKIADKTTILNRDLSESDLFLEDFFRVIKRHSDYRVVNKFVSISTERVRGTEDIDLLIPLMDSDKFKAFFEDALKNRFWCYLGYNSLEADYYLKELKKIRFAGKKDKEDAAHLRAFFSDILDNKKFKEYKKIVEYEISS